MTDLRAATETPPSSFMSKAAYDIACSSLVERSRDKASGGLSLGLRGEENCRYLTIKRPFYRGPSLCQGRVVVESSLVSNGDTQLSYTDDDDDCAAIYHGDISRPAPSVEYNIFLSPTFRVPVLYFFLHGFPPGSMNGIEAVYKLLVPESTRPVLQEVGVLGGITMANHPVTDSPAFLIHPCRTEEAMREIVGSRNVSPLEYLQIWMGLAGSCVGLHIPTELVVGTEEIW